MVQQQGRAMSGMATALKAFAFEKFIFDQWMHVHLFKQENCNPKSDKIGRSHGSAHAYAPAIALHSEQTRGRGMAEFDLLTSLLLSTKFQLRVKRRSS